MSCYASPISGRDLSTRTGRGALTTGREPHGHTHFVDDQLHSVSQVRVVSAVGVGVVWCGVVAIMAQIWVQMRPQRMAPDVAMMVLEAKVPTKLCAATCVYHPTAAIQHTNDALLLRC